MVKQSSWGLYTHPHTHTHTRKGPVWPFLSAALVCVTHTRLPTTYLHRVCECECVSVCLTNLHTHSNNKHGRVLSWLHGLPFLHASAWFIMFFCIFFKSDITSNTFWCVRTPAPFCCTLWQFSSFLFFSMKYIGQFLVAVVSGVWRSNSSH